MKPRSEVALESRACRGGLEDITKSHRGVMEEFSGELNELVNRYAGRLEYGCVIGILFGFATELSEEARGVAGDE
jgi:hypothetical protein